MQIKKIKIMEAIIFLIIIGLILTLVGQVVKGVSNIFSVVGRVGGWILGIIIIIFLFKMFLI